MADNEEGQKREAEQNRSYRRLVAIVFAVSVTAICALVFRGIVRQLDRMPPHDRPLKTDDRALLACADDLLKLEGEARKLAARAFGEAGDSMEVFAEWSRKVGDIDHEREAIVARCLLDAPGHDEAARALGEAASHLEGLTRSYRLLFDRHGEDGRAESRAARDQIARARQALSKR